MNDHTKLLLTIAIVCGSLVACMALMTSCQRHRDSVCVSKHVNCAQVGM